MAGQQPLPESDSAGARDNLSATLDHLSLNVVPIQPIRPLNPLDGHVSVSERNKTGVSLLFSGIFLGLVGLALTSMGCLKYSYSKSFESTQLLGPVLLSVGGTFFFISVCKFRMLSCQVLKQRDSDEELSESLDIPVSRAGQSFVFNGINQPIMFHTPTVMQYIPTPYGSVTQVIDSTNGVPRDLPPHYYNVCQMGNAAFTGDDSRPANTRLTGSLENPDDGKGSEEDCSAEPSSPPPAYRTIYPSLPGILEE
uniref:Transmembrane protein 174 n=1 Tax=Esox lucius TaxID=8010 RepID=A0A3P8X9T4_ESOLU